MKTCPVCKGKGTRMALSTKPFKDSDPIPDIFEEPLVLVTCYKCNGTGKSDDAG